MTDRDRPDDTLPPLDAEQGAAFAECIDRLNAGAPLGAGDIQRRWPAFAAVLIERLRYFEELAEPAPATGIPTTFGGYRIVRELGRGGMGVVYEAVEEALDRPVALKVLPGGRTVHHKTVARFRREARIVGKLDHPSIVAIHCTGVENDTPYIAMELVRGETLERVLEKHRLRPGEDSRNWATGAVTVLSDALAPGPETAPGPAAEATAGLDLSYAIRTAKMFAEVAAGLHHAHSRGVVHRDLKPSNLILDAGGSLRILDFGIARLEGQDSLTLSGEVMGTPRYMSPEQAGGRGPVDARSDVYSLGATLYEVLTLTPPFAGRTAQEVIQNILHADPRPLRPVNPRVPGDLETIVLKCLAKDPGARYGTAEALAQDLERFTRGDPIEARPESLGERMRRRARRNRGKLAAAAALVVLAGIALFTWQRLRSVEQERRLQAYPQVVDEAVALLQTNGALFRSTSELVWSAVGYNVWSLAPGSDRGPSDLARKAVALLEEACSSVPRPRDGYYHLARAHWFAGDEEAARRAAVRAVELGSIPALVLQAEMKAAAPGATGEWKHEAERIAVDPWSRSWVEAKIAESERRWADAAKAYEELIRSDRKDGETYLGASLDVRLGAGFAHFRAGDAGLARDAFQSASEKAAEADLLVGFADLELGEPGSARKQFEKAWTRKPSDDAAYLVALFYGLRHDDHDEALAWAQRMSPSYFRDVMLAMSLSALRRFDEALEVADRLVAAEPGYALSYVILTQALPGPEGLQRSARAAEKAVELAPQSGAARSLLANVRRFQGDMNATVKLLEESIALEPAAVDSHYYLGLAYMQFGRFGDAAAAVRRAIELAGAPRKGRFAGPSPQLALGQCLLLSGQAAQAEQAFARAAELSRAGDPDDPRWVSLLVRVLQERGSARQAVAFLEGAIEKPFLRQQAGPSLESQLASARAAARPDLPTFGTVLAAFAAASHAPIVTAASPWRCFRGRSDPGPGLSWTRVDFDASSWEPAAPGYGYGDDDDATVLGDMRGAYSTVYARCELDAVDPQSLRELRLSIEADDGFVAYLNGAEVARVRAPPGASLPHTSLATTTSPEPADGVEVILDPQAVLLPGRNILALQGLNAQLDSSDFSLRATISAASHRAGEAAHALLADFRGFVRGGGGDAQANARLEYLEALVLERDGKQSEAAARFAASLRQAPDRPEPALELARLEMELGRSAEALQTVVLALESAQAADARLWRLWSRASLGALNMPAGNALKVFPGDSARFRARRPPACASREAADCRWALEQAAEFRPIRINCGGPGFTDRQGLAWSKDRFFSGGERYWNGERSYRGEIRGAEDPAVYRTERYFGAGGRELQHAYSVPLPRGRWQVKLHFAEIYHGRPGNRVFDVLLEGSPVLENHDPGAGGIAAADIRTFDVEVGDGELTLGFRRRVGDPKISAIEVEPARSGGAPR